MFDQPRPDSVNNAFCLSCHQAGGKGGLGLDALTLDSSVTAMDDHRRQPSQHLRMVHGNIPVGWLDGGITEASQAGPEGFMLDPYLLADAASTPDVPLDVAPDNRPDGPPDIPATLISPFGASNTGTPEYQWNAVSNASWYWLWVNNDSGTPMQF